MRRILMLMVLMLLFQIPSITAAPQEQDVIEIEIPDYKVTKTDGYDKVSIPGGRELKRVGYPEVPYYVIKRWYPDKYEIQDVYLLDRSGLKTETGLNLKIYKIEWGGNEENISANVSSGWFPEQNYSWFVDEEANGTTRLVIHIFPFFYNNSTKESKFYKHYKFMIEYVESKITISAIYTDKFEYDVGEKVKIDVGIESGEESPKDIILSGIVKKYGTIVYSLPFRELKGFQSSGEATLEFDTNDFDCGRYDMEIFLMDMDGFILDRKVLSLTIGIPEVQLIEFEVDKDKFNVGEKIEFSAIVKNVGNSTALGYLVIEIKHEGEIIENFTYPFNLLAGEIKEFDGIWDTSESKENREYHITAYAVYGGGSTNPVDLIVSSSKAEKTPGFEIVIAILSLIIVAVKRKSIFGRR